jgi:hypothetical protein
LQAEIENSMGKLEFNNLFTKVVLPAPDGAETIITFPEKFDLIIKYLKLVL